MIIKEYHKILQNELNHSNYLLLVLVVSSLQLLKQVKLEVLAESLPIPILFESRRRKLRRCLRLEKMQITTLWFPCVKILLEKMFSKNEPGYLVIDRTSWSAINILMVSFVYEGRAIPIYWKFLDKKGSSNLLEQKIVLSQSIELVSDYFTVVLGDREFFSPKLASWLSQQGVYCCLRQKCNSKFDLDCDHKKLMNWGLNPGIKLFNNCCQISGKKGFAGFNLAGKWKKNYRKTKTKEPWYILTNLDS